MAFVSQEDKKAKAPAIKAVLKKYGAKGSISVRHHSTLVVTISASPFEVKDGHETVNNYYIDSHHSGEKAKFLNELFEVCNEGNHNNSDPYTDYFDVGFYVDIQLGRWNKPHVQTGAKQPEEKKEMSEAEKKEQAYQTWKQNYINSVREIVKQHNTPQTQAIKTLIENEMAMVTGLGFDADETSTRAAARASAFVEALRIMIR